MEDSFRVRADKVFGSLGGNTTSPVGISSSLWCLGDEEIERGERNRDKDYLDEGDAGLESGPPVVRKFLDSDLHDLSDGEEEEEEDDEEIDVGIKKRRRDNNTSDETGVDEYLEVQSNIGRDCTLDYEEEEDQYDKVAVGVGEPAGDRLYMRDVKTADYEIHELNEYNNGLPDTFHDIVRDPRANYTAAKIRLKEDAAEANTDTDDLNKRELDGDNLKPILKKRENSINSKSEKHVRFVFDPNTTSTRTDEDQHTSSETCKSEDCTVQEQASDLRNPSKYTCYAFDSSSDDMDDDHANRKAYMDFFDNLNKIKSESSMDDDVSVEIPKSVVFTPRRKKEEGSAVGKRTEHENINFENKRRSVGITAAEELREESESCAMEEDEPCQASVIDEGGTFRKPSRQYRARVNFDFDGDSV